MFVGGVRLGVWGVVLVVCVCVSMSGVLFVVGVCVCDLVIFFLQVARRPIPMLRAGAPSIPPPKYLSLS